jgi:hypothetical protein
MSVQRRATTAAGLTVLAFSIVGAGLVIDPARQAAVRPAHASAPVSADGDAAGRAVAAAFDTATPHPDFESVTPPVVGTVRVVGDTVWFLESIPFQGSPTSSYAFVRSTGEWLRTGPRLDLERGPDPMDATLRFEPVEAAPGLRLVHLPNHLTHFHVVQTEAGATHYLPREIPPARKRELVEAVYWYRGDVDDDEVRGFPVESAVSAWAVDGGTLWLGRAGGWTEMTGGLGGLVQVDRSSLEMQSVWTEHLASATVTGLAFAAGDLWVGTAHPGEYGPGGWTGLLRHDPRSGRWVRLTPDDSPLPDLLIWDLAAAGDSVWLATPTGLAVVDARTGVWDVRRFLPVLGADSLIFELVDGLPATDPVREVAFRLMERLEVEERADFMAAVRLAPRRPFVAVYRTNEGWGEALAHPAFVPFLIPALEGGGWGASIAAEALARIPPTAWDPRPVRKVMTSRPPYHAALAASALARAGHPEGLEWLRSALADTSLGSARAYVMPPLGQVRDGASIPRLAALLGDPAVGYSAFQTLTAMDTEDAWLALAEAAGELPRFRKPALNRAMHAAPGHATRAPRAGEALVRLARRTLREDGAAFHAAAFLLRRGAATGVDGQAMDALVGAIAAHERPHAAAATLLRVTGADTSAVPTSAGEWTDVAEFWRRWWRQHEAGFEPVGDDAGEAALIRWNRRHPE